MDTALRIALLDSFEQLQLSLAVFADSLRDQTDQPIWVAGTHSPEEAYSKAIELYTGIWYLDGQAPNTTRSCPGLIGATASTLDAAIHLNIAKKALQKAVTDLRAQLKPAEISALVDEIRPRSAILGELLGAASLGRLHLKQAYRKIVVLDPRPDKVGFTWAQSNRSIRILTKKEAMDLLTRARSCEEDPIMHQISRLDDEVREDEALAQVKPVVAHLRANTVRRLARGIAGAPSVYDRSMTQAYLPMLVPHDPTVDKGLPFFREPDITPGDNLRFSRSDSLLEDQEFLPAVHIFRYRDRRVYVPPEK